MNTSSPSHPISRRTFLERSGAAVAGGVVASQFGSKAFAADKLLRIGLVGCGGRGTGAAGQALAADSTVSLVAMADAFADRIETSHATLKNQAGDKVQVEDSKRFVGLDAYQKLLASGVDVVILASPPGFRPLHLKAAVDAGVHIFCEKPVAVDAPGVRSVLATAEEARKKNTALMSGFCWRYSYPEREAYKQIHDGAIGDIRAIYATYNSGALWSRPRQPEWTDMEWQVRDWLYFTWLSGDMIVEQSVHSVDKISWALKDALPLRATAHGGRQVRVEPQYGHIFDHFEVAYEFPNDVRAFLFARQQQGCSTDNSDYIMGSKGVCTINGFRPTHVIKGETNWKYAGPKNNMYQTEHDELFASIRAGTPINDGVRMANSTMMGILGRMAAYTGQTITWEDAIASKEDLTPPSYDWKQPLPVPPVAMPGVTKFI